MIEAQKRMPKASILPVLTLCVTPAVRSYNQASLSATLNLGDFDASRHPCGSVIQPSELGCATLTLRGIDASRHPCGSVIQPSELGCATLTLRGTDHFCVCALVGATLACACKHAFAALDLQAVHFTKAIFRGTLEFSK